MVLGGVRTFRHLDGRPGEFSVPRGLASLSVCPSADFARLQDLLKEALIQQHTNLPAEDMDNLRNGLDSFVQLFGATIPLGAFFAGIDIL